MDEQLQSQIDLSTSRIIIHLIKQILEESSVVWYYDLIPFKPPNQLRIHRIRWVVPDLPNKDKEVIVNSLTERLNDCFNDGTWYCFWEIVRFHKEITQEICLNIVLAADNPLQKMGYHLKKSPHMNDLVQAEQLVINQEEDMMTQLLIDFKHLSLYNNEDLELAQILLDLNQMHISQDIRRTLKY